MRQKSGPPKETSERVVKDIRRATRKRYSAEKKIKIVLDGLRGEDSIAVNTGPKVHQRNGVIVHHLAVAEGCP